MLTPKSSILIFHLILQVASSNLDWKFPIHFKFGISTSAYQIEGGYNEDGKGLNIWDEVTNNRSELIKDGNNANIACDSYHNWEEDIEMVKKLGVDYYRISLSWSRILPEGVTSKLNQAGIDYYKKIIKRLKESNIEPVVTLFHWDLPQKFAALGGWTNPLIIPYFTNYARKAFEIFGDDVKIWITINEPRLICQSFKGLVTDKVTDFPYGIAEYWCAHNVIKAHAEAYHVYDREFRSKQQGKISITLDVTWTEPYNTSDPEDIKAAERFLASDFGIFMNPIMGFDYPTILKTKIEERSKLEQFPESRLPKFSFTEKLRIRGTYDYIGINHYITYYVKGGEEPLISTPRVDLDAGGYDKRFRNDSWEGSAANWIYVVPWGLRRLLNYIKNTYNNPEIMITENGYATDNTDDLNDDKRINYMKVYLNSTLQAILEDGVRVSSYMVWTLLDNFEWDNGYTLRFGLYHVNFTDPLRKRTPKKSVDYYKNVIRTRSIT